MTIQKRKWTSAYFIPNLRAGFVESSIYPFIGGDSVARKGIENVSVIPSINLIEPYVDLHFMAKRKRDHISILFDLSGKCKGPPYCTGGRISVLYENI